jgi:hypothetical protein
MEYISDEIRDLIENKSGLGETTKKAYISRYNNITIDNGKSGDWVLGLANDTLAKLVNGLDMKDASKLAYVNLFIMIKNIYKQDVKRLEALRENLKKKSLKDTSETLEQKKIELPSYNEIDNYINGLYKNKDYYNFVINYLIFKNGLRNMDTNMLMIDSKDYNKKQMTNDNYIIVKKTECEMVICNYKTKSSYGIKRFIDRSKKLMTAIKSLGFGSLMRNQHGERPDNSNLSYYIKLYNGNSEADYFKIRIMDLQDKPNSLSKIAEICKTRGTNSIDILDTYYNANK